MDDLIVIGLGHGDEGKGSAVDYYAHQAGQSLVVRFSGGNQAGHNVVRPDSTWHCFAQLGSGSFEDSHTHLSRYMLVKPQALLTEAEVLESKGVVSPLSRLTIDPRCTIITPMQATLNQMRERSREDDRHGSCGCGVGETVSDRAMGLSIQVGDIGDPGFAKTVEDMWGVKKAEADRLLAAHPTQQMKVAWSWFEVMAPQRLVREYEEFRERVRVVRTDQLQVAGQIICEGSQGLLLDPLYGCQPYITKTPCSSRQAADTLSEMGRHNHTSVGVLAAYAHRHGPGPLPTEDPTLYGALGDPRNPENRWQGAFRVGWFDSVLANYALDANGGVDHIFLTKMDLLWRSYYDLPTPRICTAYLYDGDLSRLEGVADYSDLGDGTARITKLHPWDKPGTLLTRILSRCRPLEWIMTENETAYIRLIEDLLNTRVGVVSWGPTYEDKV